VGAVLRTEQANVEMIGDLRVDFWPGTSRTRPPSDGDVVRSPSVSGVERGEQVAATAIAAVGFAPMLALVLTVAVGAYIPLPARYGASILPGILLVTALTMRRHLAAWIFLGYAVVAAG